MPLLAAALLVAGAIPLGFIWILTSAKFEIGGASSGESTVGKVENIDQRAMEQFCTGVRATPAGTWLVGRREVGRDEQALPEGVIDLDLVAAAQPREEESEPHLFNFLNGMLLSGGDPETTYVSRLGADGVFHEVARLGETACLEVTPDGSSVFLLTGLRRPGKDNGQREQTVVLRSDDQGKSWRRLEEGFMAEANRLGWALAPRFHGKDEVWVWGDFEYGGADGGQEPGQPSGLFYSPDRGASVESIATSAPLLVDLAYARELAPNGVSWGDYNGKHGQIKAHVAQLDAERAAIWVSQTFRYGPPEGRYLTSSILVTTQAELRREGGRWQMGAIRRTDGVAVERLEQNMDGRVIAVLDHPDESRSLIAEPRSRRARMEDHRQAAQPVLAPAVQFRAARVLHGQECAAGQHHEPLRSAAVAVSRRRAGERLRQRGVLLGRLGLILAPPGHRRLPRRARFRRGARPGVLGPRQLVRQPRPRRPGLRPELSPSPRRRRGARQSEVVGDGFVDEAFLAHLLQGLCRRSTTSSGVSLFNAR